MLLKRHDNPNSHYDIIVIGAGLGGMTAANILGKNGKKVLLLEAHNKLGGFATWFNRKGGHTFDVSLHGFPHGMIKTCRRYWGQDIASDIVQLKRVRFVNPQFNLETTFTREDFTRKLIDEFKVTPDQVNQFFDTVFNMNFFDDQELSNAELFERFFPGRNDVVRFLMEPIVYANGSTLEDPAITYGIVFSNFMRKGVYTFVGGTDGLIKKMRDQLIENGVDVKLNSKIQKIVVEKGQLRGIELNGKLIEAPVVLSNANLKTTILSLVGKQHFDEDYVERVEKTRLNTSSCQVYMGIKAGETLPDIGDLVFTSTADTFNTKQLLAKQIVSRTFSVYYPSGRPGGNGQYAVVSSTNAKWEDWANLSKEDYAREKEKMVNETIECLEKFIPGVKEKIDYIDAATPLTVKRYTHHPMGTSFGTKFEGLEPSMQMHEQIPGLYHTGSVGIIMSGWLGAANYGAIQSNKIESYLSSLKKQTQNIQNQISKEENHAQI